MILKFKFDGITYNALEDMVNSCQLRKDLEPVMNKLKFKKRKVRNQDKIRYIAEKGNVRSVFESLIPIIRTRGIVIPKNCNITDSDRLLEQIGDDMSLIYLVRAISELRSIYETPVLIKIIERSE